MVPNVFECAHNNSDSDLPPIPDTGAALAIPLIHVTHDGFNVGAGGKMLQQPRRNSRRAVRVHALPPSSSGKPCHNFTSDRCVSRTSFNPRPVTWKYFFARPPRSGVGSPSSDVTKPLSSSRSSAAYTLPTATSRPVRCSSSSHIGTPYAFSPRRMRTSITISSKLPNWSRLVICSTIVNKCHHDN